MEYYILSFRSRAESIKISKLLARNGIYNELINTPKEAQIGCGLSIKFAISNINVIKNIIKNVKTSTFAGFFACRFVANKWFVRSI